MADPPNQPTRFQFSLRAVLLAFVVVASSLGLHKEIGIVLAIFVIFCSIAIRLNGIKTRFEVFTVIVIFLLLLGLMQPASDGTHEPYRIERCHDRLSKIAQALNVYHDTYGRFPPASVSDSKGCPAHSWRVLILPQLGYEELYNRYNFDDSWDAPDNSQLATEIPYEYKCPMLHGRGQVLTNRVALIGNDTVFRANRSLQGNQVDDAASATITLVETDGKNGVHWMEPVDFPVEDAVLPPPEDQPVNATAPNSLALGPIHLGCFHVAMADGTVSCLRTDVPQSAFDALATANGGESVTLKALTRTEPSAWAKPVSLAIFVASSIAMFYGAHRAFLNQAKTQMQADSDTESCET